LRAGVRALAAEWTRGKLRDANPDIEPHILTEALARLAGAGVIIMHGQQDPAVPLHTAPRRPADGHGLMLPSGTREIRCGRRLHAERHLR